jgi:acetyl esterase/lipase
MSGGAPLTIEGRTLDARAQFLAARAKGQTQLYDMPVAEARVAAAKAFALFDRPAREDVDIQMLSAPRPGDDGAIPIRVYRPRLPNRLTPALVYFHMGGGVIWDLEICHHFCSSMAAEAGCLVLSVDYRRAPEHKFPAALDDALCAFRWARDHARALGGNSSRIAVGGDSAGGMLAAAVAQETRRLNERTPVLQLLIYPAVDWTAESGSMISYGESFPLNTPIMHWFREQFLNSLEDAADVRASPGRNPDLRGLPPALVYTAGHDPLVDQGRDYAEGLKVSGVPVLYRCFDSLPHGFTAMSGVLPAAASALTEIALDLRRTLG